MDQGREGRGRDARAHGKCTAAADAFLSTQIERGHVREITTLLPQIIRVLSVIRFALKVDYLIRFLCGPLCISLLSLRFIVISTDRKSTRLNSSHLVISYAVFCL